MSKRGEGNKPKSKTVWGHEFSRDWASRQQVLARITEVVRDPVLALDLYLDASRSGAFRSARMHKDPETGAIAVELLSRSAWRQVPFGNDVSVTILGDHEGIFTSREDLDRLYPTERQREAASQTASVGKETQPEPRRKSGPKPTGNWELRLAALLGQISRSEPKKLDNVETLADEVMDFLQKQIDWAPPKERVKIKIREIRQLTGF